MLLGSCLTDYGGWLRHRGTYMSRAVAHKVHIARRSSSLICLPDTLVVQSFRKCRYIWSKYMDMTWAGLGSIKMTPKETLASEPPHTAPTVDERPIRDSERRDMCITSSTADCTSRLGTREVSEDLQLRRRETHAPERCCSRIPGRAVVVDRSNVLCIPSSLTSQLAKCSTRMLPSMVHGAAVVVGRRDHRHSPASRAA